MPEREKLFEPPKEWTPRKPHDEEGGDVVVAERTARRRGTSPKELKIFPEGREKMKNIVATLSELAADRNPEVIAKMLRHITEKAPQGGLRAEDLAEIYSETASREELREHLFTLLEEQNILSYGPRQEVIVDIERLQNIRTQGGWRRFTNRFQNKKFSTYLENGVGSMNLLMYAFEGVSVISRSDWEEGKRDGRSLFYSPASFDDACNPEKIRQSQFYTTVHETIKNVKHGVRYPSGKDYFSLSEATIPLLLYHPKYGDGHRDAQGRLMVRHRDGSSRPVHSKWFTKEMQYFGGSPAEGESIGTPHSYFQERTPRLLEHDVVRLTDFKAMTVGGVAERYRIAKDITSNGNVTIEHIRYFLGRAWEKKKKTARAYKLSPTLGGVTERNSDGVETLTHVFDLTNINDPRLRDNAPLKKKGESGKSWSASRAVTNCRPYDPKEFHTRQSNESDEIYAARLHAVDDFNNLLRVSQILSRELGVNMNQLTLQEQQWAAASIKTVERQPEKVKKFVRQYGREGLRAFVSVTEGVEMAQHIFTIGEHLKPKVAGHVFQKYAEILDAAGTVRTFLLEQFPNMQGAQERVVASVIERLLQQGKTFLATIAIEGEKGGWNQFAENKVIAQLEQMKADVMLFASACKIVAKEQSFSLDAIQGVVTETKDGASLIVEERAAMRRIFRENRREYPKELLQSTLREFDEAIVAEGNEFHLLKHERDCIAFLRFEERPNGNVYLGSLNVRPEARGSAIGNAFLRSLVEEKSRIASIEAVVYEKNDASRALLAKLGFREVGVDTNYHGTGTTFYQLELPKQKAQTTKVP